jgi:ribosomal protein S18 acetylase RimI-like enzyme
MRFGVRYATVHRPLAPSDYREVPEISEGRFTAEQFATLNARLNVYTTIAVPQNDHRTPVGWIIYKYRQKSMQILDIATIKHRRRAGIASRLIAEVSSKAMYGGREFVKVAVPERNDVAIKLFAARGFLAEEVRRGFYPETDEDAYVMTFRPGNK